MLESIILGWDIQKNCFHTDDLALVNEYLEGLKGASERILVAKGLGVNVKKEENDD